MEQNEKYGIELEAETDKFKKQMKDVENDTKKFGERVKENLQVRFEDYATIIGYEVKKAMKNLKSTIRESYGLDKQQFDVTTGYDKQIEATQKKINSLIFSIAKLKSQADTSTNRQQILDMEVQLEKLKNTLNSLYDKRIDVLSWEDTEKYIESLYIELEKCETQFEKLSNASKKTPAEIGAYELLKNKIADLKFEIETAESTLVEFNNEGRKTKNIFVGLGGTVSKGFNDVTRNIKRLTFSMIGVHSAYRVLTRAVSTYSQYDINFTQKMKSAWASLGAFLAPITNFIGTLVQKAVGYLNVFIKALTGVDYIQKANDAYKYSKSVKEVGKSAKEATKSLTAMDEITNIPDAFSGGAGDTGLDDFNPFEALQQVELNQEWVKRIQEIAKALKPVYNTIKDIIDWCIKHPDIIASMLGGLALLTLLGKVIGYAGAGTLAGTGLAGILGILLALVSIGIIVISIKTVWTNASQVKEANENVVNMADDLSGKYKQARKEFEKLIKSLENNNPKVKEIFDTSIKKVDSLKDSIKDLREEKEKLTKPQSLYEAITLGNFRSIWYKLGGDKKRQESMFYTDIQESYTYLNNLKLLYEQGKLNKEQTQQYKDALQNFVTTLDDAGYGSEKVRKEFDLNKTKTKEVSDMYGTAKTSLDNLGKSAETSSSKVKTSASNIKTAVDNIPTKKTIKVDADTKKAGEKLDALGKALNMLKPNFVTGGFASIISKLRSYDVGTPYVPEDGIAMIHKGERIIPAEYNNENLFNNKNSETTNALLIELIQAVEENGDKVPVFNINGKEFAKATINDYRDEENRLNRNTIVKRV